MPSGPGALCGCTYIGCKSLVTPLRSTSTAGRVGKGSPSNVNTVNWGAGGDHA